MVSRDNNTLENNLSIKILFDERFILFIFVIFITIFYSILPLFANTISDEDPYWIRLFIISVISSVILMFGYRISIFDRNLILKSNKINIKSNYIHLSIWFSFVVFIAVTVSSARNIPILEAFKGATAQELSEYRADFLKMRDGWYTSLNYMNAVYTSTIIPISLAAMFLYKHKLRYFALLIFIFYTELSLEKALFLRALIPVLYIELLILVRPDVVPINDRGVNGVRNRIIRIAVLVAGCLFLLYANTVLARGSDAYVEQAGGQVPSPPSPSPQDPSPQDPSLKDGSQGWFDRDFFTARYVPQSAMDQLVWRIVAVPVFTANDSLKVLDQHFDGHHLMGATSTLISRLFGMKREPFEALVHGYQFSGGQESPTGRSNSVYFIDGFVNFGWFGVVVFSLFVGQSLRWFGKTPDFSIQALWPLYIMNLFQSGLIGNLLSNGFIIIFLVMFFVNIDYKDWIVSLSRSHRRA